MADVDLKPIIEALIFASPDPLTPKMLFKLLETEPKEDVESALESLKRDYDRPGGLQLVEVAGGYQIVTKPELHEWVRRLFHERTSQRLTVQALENVGSYCVQAADYRPGDYRNPWCEYGWRVEHAD